MEVYQSKDNENQNIYVNTKNGKIHQQWDVVYADEFKGEPGKGELNPGFGFYVERPFHIMSTLPKRLYLEGVDRATDNAQDRYSQMVIK